MLTAGSGIDSQLVERLTVEHGRSYASSYWVGYHAYREGRRNAALDYGMHRRGYLHGWRDAVEFEQSELERESSDVSGRL